MINSATAYKPNLMQTLLGRNYKWWYVFYHSYQVSNTSFGLKVFIQISIIIQALIVLWIWQLGNASITVFTYLIIGRIYKSLSDTYIFDPIGNQIISGEINKDMLLPQSYFKMQLFRSFGFRAMDNLISAVGMSFAGLIAVLTFAKVSFNLNELLILILFLPISYFIQFLLGLCVGFSAFFLIF